MRDESHSQSASYEIRYLINRGPRPWPRKSLGCRPC
jgi:hypothetical protein